MKVSVLMVAYGQWELTRECVHSLLDSPGVDISITIVDNAPSSSQPDWMPDSPAVRYRKAERNLGYAGGMNLAFRLSRADEAPYTLVANNDTRFGSGTLASLAEFLESQPQAGAAGPPVFWESDPDRVWSAGGFLEPWLLRYDQRRWPQRNDLPKAPVAVDMISGCALMVRSELFNRLDGFREDLFMYYEDADLCARIRRHGQQVFLVPDGQVLHHVEASSRERSPWLPEYCSRRNRLLLSPEVQSPLQRSFFIAWMVAGTLIKTLLSLSPERTGRIPWLWRALLHGLVGRGGPPGEMA